MAPTDQRSEVAITRFESKEIIPEAVRNDAELLGRFCELRFVQAQQFQFLAVDGRDVHNERRPAVWMMEREVEKRAGLVRRIGRVGFFECAKKPGVSDQPSSCGMVGVTVSPKGRQH